MSRFIKIKRLSILFFIGFCLNVLFATDSEIDRRAVVERNNVVIKKIDAPSPYENAGMSESSPTQIGNGEFAMGIDLTGLQTFIPFNTMSHWGWKEDPIDDDLKGVEFEGVTLKSGGKSVRFMTEEASIRYISESFRKNSNQKPMSSVQKRLAAYLAQNPHRVNLGRLGFEFIRKDGKVAEIADLKNMTQTLDLYKAVVKSSFEFEGKRVEVTTICHQSIDAIAVCVKSELLKDGKIRVFLNFPFTQAKYFENHVGDYNKKLAHKSLITKSETGTVQILREMGALKYFTNLYWEKNAKFSTSNDSVHKFYLQPEEDNFSFVCHFSKENQSENITFSKAYDDNLKAWEDFWNSGAAVDLSDSIDQRWRELERRMILSQYLMKINCSGSLPPQESGLVNNGWFGRYHFEMFWWHLTHFYYWGRPELAKKQIAIYKKNLEAAIEIAQKQGYKGARWPKCLGGEVFREWPHFIHATLIWQQPHPIYFAELEYRNAPTEKTLQEWKNVVFKTADFMADFLVYNNSTHKYDLYEPITLVSENFDPLKTRNPAFDLSYWRYGLTTAIKWAQRLGEKPDEKWIETLENLAPIPLENGTYISCQTMENMWQNYNFEHPSITGVFGMLPDSGGLDIDVYKNTLLQVAKKWNFKRVWGWDFPMMAMGASRIGERELALSMLLHSSDNFNFDQHGYATGGPFPYLPSNGAFLTSMAMMLGGWDNASESDFDDVHKGLPKNGKWKVKTQGFKKIQ